MAGSSYPSFHRDVHQRGELCRLINLLLIDACWWAYCWVGDGGVVCSGFRQFQGAWDGAPLLVVHSFS